MGNKKISVCAYTDGKTEAYEIREDSKLLWNREFPIGQGLSDFLYADMDKRDLRIKEIYGFFLKIILYLQSLPQMITCLSYSKHSFG